MTTKGCIINFVYPAFLLCRYSENYYIITMDIEQKNNIEDEVIRIYMDIYLNAIKSEKSQKYVDLVQDRMLYLVKRRRLHNP